MDRQSSQLSSIVIFPRPSSPSEGIGVLFSELLEKDDTELGEQTVLLALLDDDGQLAREIGGLLTDLRALVVEAPKDGRDDLGEVGLDANAWRSERGQLAAQGAR